MPKKPKTNPHSINFSSLWSTLPIFVPVLIPTSVPSVSLSAKLKGIVAEDEWIIFTVLFPQKFFYIFRDSVVRGPIDFFLRPTVIIPGGNLYQNIK